MKQLVQLQQQLKSFEEAGIAVVALTYDAPDLQQAFIANEGITYPFLSDIEASSVMALDILNTEYQPGDGAYGIPYPGIFVLDKDLNIVGKVFVDSYTKRVDAQSVLAYAKSVLL